MILIIRVPKRLIKESFIVKFQPPKKGQKKIKLEIK
jgi:hypothetical protein